MQTMYNVCSIFLLVLLIQSLPPRPTPLCWMTLLPISSTKGLGEKWWLQVAPLQAAPASSLMETFLSKEYNRAPTQNDSTVLYYLSWWTINIWHYSVIFNSKQPSSRIRSVDNSYPKWVTAVSWHQFNCGCCSSRWAFLLCPYK